jgi:hypothetical protein
MDMLLEQIRHLYLSAQLAVLTLVIGVPIVALLIIRFKKPPIWRLEDHVFRRDAQKDAEHPRLPDHDHKDYATLERELAALSPRERAELGPWPSKNLFRQKKRAPRPPYYHTAFGSPRRA